ncbi:MAG: hypothetical protein ABR527_00685 [Gemmatimonadota bacterium]
MTTGGWIMMLVAWGFILGLTGWCIWRVLGFGGRKPSYEGPEPPVVPTA